MCDISSLHAARCYIQAKIQSYRATFLCLPFGVDWWSCHAWHHEAPSPPILIDVYLWLDFEDFVGFLRDDTTSLMPCGDLKYDDLRL